MGRPAIHPITRFWAKVEITSSCWLWRGALSQAGYGRFTVEHRFDGGGRQTEAHIFAYEIMRGSIPQGLVLDHLCRNTKCVNPDHLEPVTEAENVLRGVGAGALNKRKTHCPKGHPYDETNTEHRASGRRRCRECNRAALRAAYWRNPERERERTRQRRGNKING